MSPCYARVAALVRREGRVGSGERSDQKQDTEGHVRGHGAYEARDAQPPTREPRWKQEQ